MKAFAVLITVFLFVMPVHAKYGGGTGAPDDPYQIATTEDLMLLGDSPEDYDKNFIMTADIDLDPNLLGRRVFDRAVIAPDTNDTRYGFQGAVFTGVFDGNGHTISRLAINGAEYLGLFGELSGEVSNLGLEAVDVSGTGSYVGGLVGRNEGSIATSYSTGAVIGEDFVGGLVGSNFGPITNCYAAGSVTGSGYGIGGLMAYNGGTLNRCYSTGAVSGNKRVGGLVATDSGRVLHGVWDVETSGLSGSAGGAGLTTAQMMDPDMLALNGFGNDPNWVLDSGRDYPRLVWEGIPGQTIPEPVIDWLDGTGTLKDPFQIEDADQLLLLHKSSVLWDKHFVLNGDIDLDPNLPGRSVFGQAAIRTFEGSFVGNGHVILNLQIEGGDRLGLFGRLSKGSVVRALGLENVSVHGTGNYIGGLVGHNGGYVLNCYSSGAIRGDNDVGGLVGSNEGCVTECYSTSVVSGTGRRVGGLVGNNYGYMNYCFWDVQTSGQTSSAGGIGLTTPQMQMASTFLDAGWDFVDETINGTEDIWWILEGQDYPRLKEFPEGFRFGPLPAFSPEPEDEATEVMQPIILHWAPADPTLQHDIYFGEDKQAVANATTENLGIYRGRQPPEMTTYDPGTLEWNKAYYWRIDEVNEANAHSPWKGRVWNFTTADYILVLVVDDFERYDDHEICAIWHVWIDGWINGTGSRVGYVMPPFAEQRIVHGGWQSMPFFYDNDGAVDDKRPGGTTGIPFYSEAVRTFESPWNWTINDADTLTFYFRGEADNDPDTLYVGIEDSDGRMAVATHPDADALLTTEWQKWHISLVDMRAVGVDLTSVLKIYIGVGDRGNPHPGGAGKIYIDDIWVTNRMP